MQENFATGAISLEKGIFDSQAPDFPLWESPKGDNLKVRRAQAHTPRGTDGALL